MSTFYDTEVLEPIIMIPRLRDLALPMYKFTKSNIQMFGSWKIHLSRVVQENVGVHEGLDGDLDHAQPRHLLKRIKVEKEKSNLQI